MLIPNVCFLLLAHRPAFPCPWIIWKIQAREDGHKRGPYWTSFLSRRWAIFQPDFPWATYSVPIHSDRTKALCAEVATSASMATSALKFSLLVCSRVFWRSRRIFASELSSAYSSRCVGRWIAHDSLPLLHGWFHGHYESYHWLIGCEFSQRH